MTVNVNDTVERYTVAGVGPYPFSFRIFADTDLQLTACSTATPPVPTLLVYLTHYTVTGANVQSGGGVTLTAGAATTYAGYTLDIRSNTPNTQPTSIRNIGRFLPEIHEDEYDHLEREVQDLKRQLLACVRYPDNTLNDGMMTPLSAWLSRYLTINSSGVLTPAVLSSTTLTAALITSLLTGSTTEQDAILALLMERTDTSPGLVSLKRSFAEISASKTPTDYSVPSDEFAGTIQLARFANYHGDAVTNDYQSFADAIAVAEVSAGLGAKVEGGTIVIPNGTTFVSQQVRVGSWVTLKGMGPYPTRINFNDAITGQCFRWEISGGGQVFGTHFEDLFIGMANNATHAIYSDGAHEWSGLRRVHISNVGQTGVELASTGGPYAFTFEDVGIVGSLNASLSSRIGMVLNNGSINNIYGLQIHGFSTKNFAKGLRFDFGHAQGGGVHFEFCDIGVSCEQTQVGGHVVSLDAITGTTTVTTLVNIAATFVGTVSLKNIVSGSTNVRLLNNITTDSYNFDLAHYEYTTVGGAPSVIHHLFPATSATSWVNKGYQGAFNIAASGRIYSLLHGFDGATKANAIGVSYDGTGYETVIGCANTVGGAITEKFRAGRLVNTTAVPVKFPTYTVATLPTASIVGAGSRAFASDANATAFFGVVAAGGANFVPVFSDGTNWRIG